jgi:hypothetical protein
MQTRSCRHWQNTRRRNAKQRTDAFLGLQLLRELAICGWARALLPRRALDIVKGIRSRAINRLLGIQWTTNGNCCRPGRHCQSKQRYRLPEKESSQNTIPIRQVTLLVLRTHGHVSWAHSVNRSPPLAGPKYKLNLGDSRLRLREKSGTSKLIICLRLVRYF